MARLASILTRAPSEDGEGTFANFAFLAIFLLGHTNVRIIAETRLTQDGKLGIFPILSVVSVGSQGGRHLFSVTSTSEHYFFFFEKPATKK